MNTELVKTILVIGSAVVMAAACTSKDEQSAEEPVAAEATVAAEDQEGNIVVSDREMAEIDEATAAGQEVDIEKQTLTRGVVVPGVGAVGQRTTEVTAENVGPAFRYPLVDPADAGHPMQAPALMQEGQIVGLYNFERTGPIVVEAKETETVVATVPEEGADATAGAAGARGEATPCGKTIVGESAGAVGDPCLAQADFIASLNLSEAQLARLRELGMPEESLAH